MNNEFNGFLTKLKINGFKHSPNIPNKLSANYSLLFESFTEIIHDDIRDLSKQEEQSYNDLMNNNGKVYQSLNNNKYLLETEDDITALSISSLEKDINLIDKEIALYESQITKETNQSQVLIESLKHSNKQIEQLYLEKQLKDFETNYLNIVNSKTKGLNTASERILGELTFNNNQCANATKAVIGSNKIDNIQYEKVMISISTLIDMFEASFEIIKQSPNSHKESIDMSEFIELLGKLKTVKEGSIELEKNQMMKQFKFSLEKYKNQIINEYIIDHDFGDMKNNDGLSGYELEQLLKKVFNIEHKINQIKYTNIQNAFSKQLYQNILFKNKHEQIQFIKDFSQMEKLISSLYPYLVSDLQSTQDIYDNLSELIETYSSFQKSLSFKQTYLRKAFSEAQAPEKKITIDERDVVGLYLAQALVSNKKKNKVIVYEYGDVLNKVNEYIEKNRENKTIKDFTKTILQSTCDIMKQMNFIKDHNLYLTHVISYDHYLSAYKDQIKPLIEFFLQLSKGKLHIKSEKISNLYEALFIYYYHKEMYIKETSKHKKK